MSRDAAVDLLMAELPLVDRRDAGFALFLDTLERLTAERADDGAADMAGGVFLDLEMPAALEPGAVAAAMAAIDREIDHERRLHALRAAARVLDEVLELPAPVRDAALVALEAGFWIDAGSGVRRLPLSPAGETRLALVRLEPGAKAPKADHDGREIALILSGALRDARGVHARGDVATGPLRIKPEPAAEPGAVCFLLTLTRAPTGETVRALLDRTLKG